MIRTQLRRFACMDLFLPVAGCALSARDGADATLIERVVRQLGSDLPALKKGHYPQPDLYFRQATKVGPSHYEKAEHNLQYVMQLRGAYAGDGTRALSKSNRERRWWKPWMGGTI